jgi:hypothetical protein
VRDPIDFQPTLAQLHGPAAPRTPWVWGEWGQSPNGRPSNSRREIASSGGLSGGAPI